MEKKEMYVAPEVEIKNKKELWKRKKCMWLRRWKSLR